MRKTDKDGNTTKVEVEATGDASGKVTITSETVEENLRGIGEFTSQEYNFKEVDTIDKDKISLGSVSIPFTGAKYVYSYKGTIKAGIDFTEINVDLDDKNKIVTLILPDAKILSTEIDESSFEVYNSKQGLFNKVSIEDFAQSRETLKQNAEESAVEFGLLDSAGKNAETMLMSLLETLPGLDEYEIVIE